MFSRWDKLTFVKGKKSRFNCTMWRAPMLAPGRLIGTVLCFLQILTNLTKVAHNFCGINSDYQRRSAGRC
jgi:hypothetical protein